MENFPFGQPVKKVEQKDRTPKKIFILGVYASAVHAKWMSNNGKVLINAVAVASEPYIFWKGDDAEKIISKIKIPLGAGKLKAATEMYNGPSGKALDDKYLDPLGLTRQECWLCDLIPYSMLNPNQISALNKHQVMFNKFGIKKHQMRKATLKNRRIDITRQKEILNEIKISKAEYLITLGDEPLKNFIKVFNSDIPSHLSLLDNYGEINKVNIDGMSIKLLALVHPRQVQGLGRYSPEWLFAHNKWLDTTAEKIRKQLL